MSKYTGLGIGHIEICLLTQYIHIYYAYEYMTEKKCALKNKKTTHTLLVYIKC